MEKLEWTDEDGDSAVLVDAAEDGTVDAAGEVALLVVSDSTAVLIDKETAPKIVAWLNDFYEL